MRFCTKHCLYRDQVVNLETEQCVCAPKLYEQDIISQLQNNKCQLHILYSTTDAHLQHT
jgi:hypothetical protein